VKAMTYKETPYRNTVSQPSCLGLSHSPRSMNQPAPPSMSAGKHLCVGMGLGRGML
jgi:hypothetical protein